jgi:hypothetical protein
VCIEDVFPPSFELLPIAVLISLLPLHQGNAELIEEFTAHLEGDIKEDHQSDDTGKSADGYFIEPWMWEILLRIVQYFELSDEDFRNVGKKILADF